MHHALSHSFAGRLRGVLVAGLTGAALLLSATAADAATAAAPAAKRKVIFDDDLAILRTSALMLLESPDVDLLGITVVSGSQWRDDNVARTLRTLELAGRTEVPVVPGSAFPLVNTEAATKRWEALYGRLVYKGAWMDGKWPDGTLQSQPLYHAHDVIPDMPEGKPTIKAADEIAANFLIRKVREFPGQITVIATGPMTNLALAQRLDPSFAANVRELVYMGGSLNPQQRRDSVSAQQFGREYANTPRLEFNFRWDPEAASIVLRSPYKKITMVPADPSTATELTNELLAKMSASDTPLARAFRRFNETGFPLWDEIAVAVWMDPTLITQSDLLSVDVDTSFTAGYGNTLSWAAGHGPELGERPNTAVRSIDVPRFEQLMIKLLNRTR